MINKQMRFVLVLTLFVAYITMFTSCGSSSVTDSIKDTVNNTIDEKKSDLTKKLYPVLDSAIKKVEIPVIKEGDI